MARRRSHEIAAATAAGGSSRRASERWLDLLRPVLQPALLEEQAQTLRLVKGQGQTLARDGV